MAILKIVKEEEEIIRKRSKEVSDITPRIKTLIEDMKQTLHKANGCGLAAVQVGVLKRIVLVETDRLYVLINPQITSASGEQEEIEGCLSCPGKWGITHRPMQVTVRALDTDGNEVSYTGEGLTARAFCHELDHLDGKLFIDDAVRMLAPDEIEEISE